jgi:uncharacterized protein
MRTFFRQRGQIASVMTESGGMVRQLREPAILLALYLVLFSKADTGVPPSHTLILVAARSIAFGALILYLMERRGQAPDSCDSAASGSIWERARSLALRSLLVSGVLFAVAGTMRLILSYWSARQYSPVPAFPFSRDPATLSILLVTVLTAAWVEELFFRAYLLTRSEQSGIGQTPAILVVTSLFAAGHAWQGPEAIIVSAGAGIALGVIWFRTKRLAPLVLGHGVYNVLVLLISFR